MKEFNQAGKLKPRKGEFVCTDMSTCPCRLIYLHLAPRAQSVCPTLCLEDIALVFFFNPCFAELPNFVAYTTGEALVTQTEAHGHLEWIDQLLASRECSILFSTVAAPVCSLQFFFLKERPLPTSFIDFIDVQKYFQYLLLRFFYPLFKFFKYCDRH